VCTKNDKTMFGKRCVFLVEARGLSSHNMSPPRTKKQIFESQYPTLGPYEVARDQVKHKKKMMWVDQQYELEANDDDDDDGSSSLSEKEGEGEEDGESSSNVDDASYDSLHEVEHDALKNDDEPDQRVYSSSDEDEASKFASARKNRISMKIAVAEKGVAHKARRQVTNALPVKKPVDQRAPPSAERKRVDAPKTEEKKGFAKPKEGPATMKKDGTVSAESQSTVVKKKIVQTSQKQVDSASSASVKSNPPPKSEIRDDAHQKPSVPTTTTTTQPETVDIPPVTPTQPSKTDVQHPKPTTTSQQTEVPTQAKKRDVVNPISKETATTTTTTTTTTLQPSESSVQKEDVSSKQRTSSDERRGDEVKKSRFIWDDSPTKEIASKLDSMEQVLKTLQGKQASLQRQSADLEAQITHASSIFAATKKNVDVILIEMEQRREKRMSES